VVGGSCEQKPFWLARLNPPCRKSRDPYQGIVLEVAENSRDFHIFVIPNEVRNLVLAGDCHAADSSSSLRSAVGMTRKWEYQDIT
jgi:5-keto 4-deoxyuronate isomerase